MSLNKGLEIGPVVSSADTVVPTATKPVIVSSEQPWLLTIASLELQTANLERRVTELEALCKDMSRTLELVKMSLQEEY